MAGFKPTLGELSLSFTVPGKSTGSRAGTERRASNDDEGILNMENYGEVDMDAFEVSDEDDPNSEHHGNSFTYQRSAKRSIMLGLGIAPAQSSNPRQQGVDTLNAYSKMDDKSSMLTYMAVVVGAGTFSLSTSVAKIGWVQGFIVLVFLSVWHYLVAALITTLPQMLECNFKTYVDIARVCFGSTSAKVFLVLSSLNWWGACVYNLFTFQDSLAHVVNHWIDPYGTGNKGRMRWHFWVELLCILPAIGFMWRTRGNQLVSVSRAAVKSMLAATSIEILCAICHFLWRLYASKPAPVVAWREATSSEESGQVGLVAALNSMAFAYAGVGIWPYVIADMLHPENAPKVVKRASLFIGAFYTTVGTICYLGWGEDLMSSSPIGKMLDLNSAFYRLAATLISICFSVKAVCAYPLLFRPLLREVETFMAIDELPCVELRLPWALKWQNRLKLVFRIGLSLSTLGALMFRNQLQGDKNLFSLMIGVVIILVQIASPAVFVVRSLYIHKANVQRRTSCVETARRTVLGMPRAGRTIAYIGGNMKLHFIVSGIVSAISLYMSVMLIGSRFWRLVVSLFRT